MQPTPFLWENIQNRTPVKGDLGSLVVEPVQNDDEKDLWFRVVKAHHYLGFGHLFGHQIKYLGGQVVAAIRSNTPVLLAPPQWAVPKAKGSRGKKPIKPRLTEAPQKVSDLALTAVFTPTILKEGSQGPLGANLSCLRVYRVPSEEGEPVSCEWLLLLKTPEGEMKYAFSNAPVDTAPETFARVSTLRWPLEQCFQEGESFLGMGHYEHRSLRAWKRHMIYVFLAQLFYLRARLALQKKPRGKPSHDPDPRRLRAFPEPSVVFWRLWPS